MDQEKEKQPKRKKKRWNWKLASVCLALVAVVAAGGTIGYQVHKKSPVKPEEMQTVNLETHTEGVLRVGVISDTQLPPSKKLEEANGGVYKEHLKRALELLKTQNIDMLLHAGDIGDMCSKYAYETYREVFNSVFSDENTRPLELYIMGNHDTWFDTDWQTTPSKHKLYQKAMGMNPNRHLVINGYHFIAASPDNTGNADGYSQTMRKWMEEQIKVAQEQSTAGYPIFLMTHHNIPDTAYGSSDWGAEQVRQAASNYQQVVSISGHSHFSILDERSIDQNMITAFTTQGLAYVDMERNMYNAFAGFSYDKNDGVVYNPNSCYKSAPAREEEKPMCLIMNVTSKDTTIERWNVMDGREEKTDSRWTLTYPMDRGNFQYRYNERAAASTAPQFPQSATIAYNPAIKSYQTFSDGTAPTLPGVTFTAAENQKDIVNAYTMTLRHKPSGKTYSYTTYSDYYLGIASMAKTVSLPFDPTLPAGNYEVNVYANESFGKRSQPLTLSVDYTPPQIKLAK